MSKESRDVKIRVKFINVLLNFHRLSFMQVKKVQDCYLELDDRWLKVPICYVEDFNGYRVFFMHGDYSSEEFQRIYSITRQPVVNLQIGRDTISVVSRQRSFLESVPGRYFICLHLQELKEGIEVYWDPLDVDLDTIFFCEIGNTFARLSIKIEPAPHKEPSHAHFHTTLMCPKNRIVESPEPDRCLTTELPCPFWEARGKKYVDKLSRQKEYGLRILQYGAYFEYYATVKLTKYFEKRGINVDVKRLPQLSLSDKLRLLFAMSIIDNATYSKLVEVKRERDKLAHEAKPFHAIYDLEEKRAMDIIRKAEYCLEVLKS